MSGQLRARVRNPFHVAEVEDVVRSSRVMTAQKMPMKGLKRLGLILALGSLLLGGLLVSPAVAATTTGTWYSYPPQTFTTSSVVTTGSTYKSAVRPLINADGSSNWPAKRGVIPVQFDLLAAPTPTTTTTKTYDPPVWESLQGVADSVS